MLGKPNIALEGYAEDLVKFAKINIGRKRKRTYASGTTTNSPIDSSGTLRNSLTYNIISTEAGETVEISMEDYGVYVEEGRRPGKGPPIDALVEWIKKKPVKLRDSEGKFVRTTESGIRSLAFLISRSIGRNGTRPTHFLREAVEQANAKWRDKLTDSYRDTITDSIDVIIRQ